MCLRQTRYTGDGPLPLPHRNRLVLTERMGGVSEFTEKVVILQFWYMTPTNGLNTKSTSMKKHTYQQVRPRGHSSSKPSSKTDR